jgi:uncharacterized protein (DUF4415 family)
MKRNARSTDTGIARDLTHAADAAPVFTDEMLAQLKWVAPIRKTPISFRVDADVLDFFKAKGDGYQSRMNAVLRSYMEHERRVKR